MAALFADFAGIPDRDDGGFNLRIHETLSLPEKPALPLTWEGIMPDGYYGRIYESVDDTVMVVEDRVAIAILRRGKQATAHVLPDSFNEFFVSAFMLILEAALASQRQFLIHGACLVENASGLAVIVCAPSGAGKTTSSMALARDGFSLITDDASVLAPTNEAPRAWGLPRALKVHRKTADLLPWVGPLPDRWDKNGEQPVTTAQLRAQISISPPRPQTLGAIVLIGPRSDADHSIRRLSKAELLIELAGDNVAWRPLGMTQRAQERFDVLAEIVAQVPAFLLSAGTDLETLPAVVSKGLDLPEKVMIAR